MGFLNPLSLLFGVSIGALLLIYLRSRSRPTLDVSSMMLFEEVPAPVAKSRMLRLDLLFWLETLALLAMTMAVAGVYILVRQPAGSHQLHALVFDLGAGMGARQEGGSRLDEARGRARELISSSPATDAFSIIGYALEARSVLASTTRRDELFAALDKLRPLAVAARPAALRAALLDARGAAMVDIFADRPLSKEIIQEARPDGRVELHQVGSAADNTAITSLDPGVPRTSTGHCVLRNFSTRTAQCELTIDVNGKPIFHSPLIIEPRAQAVIAFPPLTDSGLIHARVVGSDALAADNERYAMAPGVGQAHALVLSPDADVRDDLARIMLAINPNFVVMALDPAQFPSSKAAAQHFDLAILHDCSDVGVNASARMFVFPEPWLQNSKRPPLVPVIGSIAVAELQSRQDTGALATPTLLGPSRVLALPGWMDLLAQGAPAAGRDSFPIAAVGHNSGGEVGVIAFDVRNHLLLDPDRMDALVVTIDTLKRIVAPQNIKVVATGSFVPVSTFAPARLIGPDGSASTLEPDEWGRVRFRPSQAGRYVVTSNHRKVEVFANYYDAAESDLSAAPAASRPRANSNPIVAAETEEYPEPVAFPLIVFATLLVLAESILLARRAMGRGPRYV